MVRKHSCLPYHVFCLLFDYLGKNAPQLEGRQRLNIYFFIPILHFKEFPYFTRALIIQMASVIISKRKFLNYHKEGNMFKKSIRFPLTFFAVTLAFQLILDKEIHLLNNIGLGLILFLSCLFINWLKASPDRMKNK